MYSKDPREVYHPAKKMWSPKTPSISNHAVKTAKSASWAELWLTERARCAAMAVQGGLLKSSRSAARSARAPCISACTAVCAPRTRRRKTWASCVVAQTAARLARWLEGARELPGGERGHANCEDTGGNCTTPTSADRARVGGAREDAARGRGQGARARCPAVRARCCFAGGDVLNGQQPQRRTTVRRLCPCPVLV